MLLQHCINCVADVSVISCKRESRYYLKWTEKSKVYESKRTTKQPGTGTGDGAQRPAKRHHNACVKVLHLWSMVMVWEPGMSGVSFSMCPGLLFSWHQILEQCFWSCHCLVCPSCCTSVSHCMILCLQLWVCCETAGGWGGCRGISVPTQPGVVHAGHAESTSSLVPPQPELPIHISLSLSRTVLCNAF